MPTPEQNKSLAESFVKEVFNNHNIQFVEETLSEDLIEHEITPGISPDKQGAVTWFRTMFAAVPNARAEIRHLITSGDRVVIHSTMSGTDTGGSCRACRPPARRSRWAGSTSCA